MAVTEKKKKTRLYKVAKEFNLSHDTLTEFLDKKGYSVKNHMSIIDEEMLDLIEKHYKKEKTDAERHARKRREFDEQDRRRRGEDHPEDELEEEAAAPVEQPSETPVVAEDAEDEKPASDDDDAAVVEEEVTAAEEVEVAEPEVVEEVVEETEETPVVEAVEPEPEVVKEVVEEVAVEEAEVPVAAEEPEPVAEKAAEEAEPEETKEVEPAPAAEAKAAKKPTKKDEVDVSIEASLPKMRGLTVKGKIDLEATMAADGKGGKGEETETGEDGKPRRKKKKKKKVTKGGDQPAENIDAEALKKKMFKRGKKGKGREVDQAEVDSAIKKTIASMSDFGPVTGRAAMRKKKRARREEEQIREMEQHELEKQTLQIYEYASVSELAQLMSVSVNQVIQALISLGVMASINQRLDMEAIELVAAEFGFDVQQHEEYTVDVLADEGDPEDTLEPRPPIVTIMGHVDHGKTKLLDFIRKTNVVAGESGGITQHIGAYTVTLDNDRRITFLDTPGHEAFTAMRARGAQVTDIVVLVVAADDSVMPQTIEAISHAQAAKVPIVVAINKIDKPEANPDRIKQQLADRNLLVEDWGGKYGCVQLSAKEGLNVQELLDRLVLEADILELKANPDREARGAVIESELDKGKGIIATVLVQKGTMLVGDSFVAGNEYGKVRALLDERGNRVDEATPATPVQVLGFNGPPQAGDSFVVVETERKAREIATNRQAIKRESDFRRVRRTTLDDISEQIKLGGVQDLPIVVKGDVDGSVEALSDSLLKLSNEEVRISVIHKNVGAISESDVLLASASNAIIIGFRVRPNLNARKLAESEDVDIRMYDIIYDAIEDVRDALEGMLRPEISEKITATVLVRETFKISKVGVIAGCYVQDGKINRNSRIRLLRDGIVAFTGNIDSLKRFKDDVREVDSGFECGLNLVGFNDIKVGDVIEAFEQVEVKRSLDQAQK
ncbi:MAG: translation initiation factor IF-2 [Ignavibacteria bacterium]|nr:MAG: translation initiation factor IF-2 [Ignavibacteria bacterium]